MFAIDYIANVAKYKQKRKLKYQQSCVVGVQHTSVPWFRYDKIKCAVQCHTNFGNSLTNPFYRVLTTSLHCHFQLSIKEKVAVKTSSALILHMIMWNVNHTITYQLQPGVTEQINIQVKLKVSHSGGECSAHKSSTLVPILPFLGISGFLIPLNGYCLLFFNKH